MAMQRIEIIQGYEIETVLNSMFCYKLHQKKPMKSHQPFL